MKLKRSISACLAVLMCLGLCACGTAPADTGASSPAASQSVAAPTETPAETPAEAPAEAPAETPAETPAEAPAEAPAETPAEAPAPAAPEKGNGAQKTGYKKNSGGNKTTQLTAKGGEAEVVLVANNGKTELPAGVFVVAAGYRDKEPEDVTFTFRGVEYSARIGTNAVGHVADALEKADKAPTQEFSGQRFDTPVIVIPAGKLSCPSKKDYNPVKITKAVTFIGEGFGVSPNAPDDITKVNPARNMEESILAGSVDYGKMTIAKDVVGTVTFDGLTLYDTTFTDSRVDGTGNAMVIRNCIFDNSFRRVVLDSNAISDPNAERALRVIDCRADGLDARDVDKIFLSGCYTELTLERLYYAHTQKLFGPTTYLRGERNAPAGGTLTFTLKECVFEDSDVAHGIAVAPMSAHALHVIAEDCTFSKFAREGDPVFRVDLPSAESTLTLRRCKMVGTGIAAAIADGSTEAKVTVEDVTVEGYEAAFSYLPARRTDAPEKIGEVVWANDKLDDPHTPCTAEESEEALRWLDCLYGDRSARFGDMHAHTDSGGKSDGATPLAEYIQQIKGFGLDFAAVLDHKQIRHAYLPEWDNDLLLCGSEFAAQIKQEGRPSRAKSLHYAMVMRRREDFFLLMKAFPEFKYTGGTDGYCGYPTFTYERFMSLVEFIHNLGGTISNAHPKQQMASDDPMMYYFGEHAKLETVYVRADSFATGQNVRLWESLLKMGKRVHTWGDSDTHAAAKNTALTSVYTNNKTPAEVLDAVRDGDCTAGCIGIQMSIDCTRMGSSLPYRKGQKLAIRVADYYRQGMKDNTVYCLKVYTDKGLAYASEFSGTQPQELVLPVEQRMYYRVEITNESDNHYVAVSNPIWLD